MELDRRDNAISLYQEIVESSPDIIFSCNLDGEFIFVNNRFISFTGIKADHIIGRDISAIIRSERLQYLWKKSFDSVICSGQAEKFEAEFSLPDQNLKIFSVYLSPILDGKRIIVGIAGTCHDIAEYKKQEDTIRHMAHHDLLTGLPNRALFYDRLTVAMSTSTRRKTKAAVIFLDLDNFKKINDTFGHAVGDVLLKMISREMTRILRKNETLARLGGDEFIILIEGVEYKDDIQRFLERVKSVFCSSFIIGRNSIHVNACFGISIFPDDGNDCEDLINKADTAMYKAKENGKNMIQFYERAMHDDISTRVTIEGLLGNAITNHELSIEYQPQFSASSGCLRGCEALLRWDNPIIGRIPPSTFIRIAEETGLIVPIGEWVLKTACSDIKKWNDLYDAKKIVSVNISAIQLRESNFAHIVDRILRDTGLPAELLELEITESVLIGSLSAVFEMLRVLRIIGVRLSLDDFGTGYSSLNYLKEMPLTVVKIDKAFVKDIRFGTVETEIINSIILLVHKLNMEIVAEGVESAEQLQYLIDAKCDYLQGFLMSRPISSTQMENLFRIGRMNLAALLEQRYEGLYI